MVVLPCGAIDSPLAARNCAIHALLADRMSARITAAGRGTSPRKRFQPRPPTSARRSAPAAAGIPLVSASSRRPAMLSPLRGGRGRRLTPWVRIQRRDRPAHPLVGHLERIVGKRPAGVEVVDRRRDAREGGREVVRGFHDHDRLLGEVDAEVREGGRAEGLRPAAAEHDVDVADGHRRRPAERHAALLEGDDQIVRDGLHHHMHVERRTRDRRRLAADPQPQRAARPRRMAEIDGDRVPGHADRRGNIRVPQQRLDHDRAVARHATARRIPSISKDLWPFFRLTRERHRLFRQIVPRRCGAAHRQHLAAKLLREALRLCRIAISRHEDAKTDLRHVAGREAVRQRNGQHAVLALHRHDPVDKRAPGRLVRHEGRGQRPAVEHRHRGPDFAAPGPDREIDEILGAGEEVGVRELLEEHHDIAGGNALLGQVAMEVVFRAEDRVRADDGAGAGEEIALAILVAVGHHRAMQAEQSDIDRHRRPELAENLVAQAFVARP